MAKKVAVLAVNPVNGCGLFQYLETFYPYAAEAHECEGKMCSCRLYIRQ